MILAPACRALAGPSPGSRNRWRGNLDRPMQIAILPEISALFVLVLARVGTLVMLMPGIGERFSLSRARLSLAFFVALIVGVAISLLQALTQIQEMTLVFVPKILAVFIALLLALPFMGDVLQAYMARIADRIASG